MFPINPDVSWEGHLWGAISGVVLAWHYRKYTIRRDKFDWEEEEDEEEGREIGRVEDGSEETGKGKGEDEKIRCIPEEKGDLKTVNSANAEKLPGFAKTEKPKNENGWPNNISHTGEF